MTYVTNSPIHPIHTPFTNQPLVEGVLLSFFCLKESISIVSIYNIYIYIYINIYNNIAYKSNNPFRHLPTPASFRPVGKRGVNSVNW